MGALIFKVTLIIYCLINYTEISFAKESGKKIFSRRLEGHTFKTIIQISLNTCNEECQNRLKCASINYNRLMKICELNAKDNSDALQVTAGWVFSSKEALPIRKTGLCKSNPCEKNETCVETRNTVECRVNECVTEDKIDNGIILGNINDVGSVLAFECQPGFSLIGLNNSICDETGEWKSFKDTRCEILCHVPSSASTLEIKDVHIITPEGVYNVSEAEVNHLSSMMIMHGSIITYQCKSGAYLIGSPFRNCTAGTWSSVPTCTSQCAFPFSYSYSSHDCIRLEYCKNGYADTFQVYEERLFQIINLSTSRFFDDVSRRDCHDKCESDASCISYNYNHKNPYCYIYPVTKLDQLSSFDNFKNWSDWSYYQRNCK